MERIKFRKQEKAIIWPVYFDSGKTRKKGRRVSKNLAISSPKILEIEEAVSKLHFEHEVLIDKGYPKTPWIKPGMLLVKKQGSKEHTINLIAKKLQEIRNSSSG